MSERSLVRLAARNNAERCDAFCRTHGIAGRFESENWLSPARTPPLYPDAVMLVSEPGVERVLAEIDAGEGCSLKDSFAALDLGAAGFRPFFSAAWLVRDPATARRTSGRGWSRLTTVAELLEWETAWGGVGEAGFFRPALLEDDRLAVLAGYDGDRIVAGAIANRSATVAGLSNVFAAAGDLEAAWRAGAGAVAALWGDLPIVGYDAGASLAAAHAAGFETIGELVVWLNA